MENNPEYISLKEASKYCSYSQEYLALRARQGKLKAVKFGRNWVTKKEWIKEYLDRVEEYNNQILERRLEKLKFARPPENLPIEEKIPWIKLGEFQSALKQGVFVGLVFLLMVTFFASILFFGQEAIFAFKKISLEISNKFSYLSDDYYRDLVKLKAAIPLSLEETGEDTVKVLRFYSLAFSLGLNQISKTLKKAGKEIAAISAPDIWQNVPKTFQEYGQWLVCQTFAFGQKLARLSKVFVKAKEVFSRSYNLADKFLEKKFGQLWQKFAQLWKVPEKVVEEEPLLVTKEGVIIAPATEKDEELKEKLRAAFSDEIIIEPKDETSGIIRPVFREPTEQKYLYILVPLKE